MSRRTWIRSCLFLSIGLAGYALVDYVSSSDEYFDNRVAAIDSDDESQVREYSQPDQLAEIASTDQYGYSQPISQANSDQYQLFLSAQGIGAPNVASESGQQSSAQYNFAAPATNQLPALPQQFGETYQPSLPTKNNDDLQTSVGLKQQSAEVAKVLTENKVETEQRDEKDLSKYANAFKVSETKAEPSINECDEKLLNSASKPNGEMDAAAKRAQGCLEKAMQLAERGALHSARAEFLKAMQISVQALDWQKGTTIHQHSFENGWKTIEAIEDFYPMPGRALGNVDEIINRHTPRIISAKDAKTSSLNQVTTEYVEYASEQLSLAGGDFLPAADALFGLAKVYQIEIATQTSNPALNSIRAETLYRACMKIEPKHAMAANELGVLLGKQGKLKEAKDILQISASLSAHPSTWKNLAIVHQDLGEFQLAQLAQREGDLAEKRWQKQFVTPGRSTSGTVAVVDNTTFARSTPANIHNPTPPIQPIPNNKAADANQNRSVAQNSRARGSQQSAQTRTADSSSYNPFTLKK